jgi:alpha-tubulin suppressor-like RCC1 family protein
MYSCARKKSSSKDIEEADAGDISSEEKAEIDEDFSPVVSAGNWHTCAVKKDKSLWCFGKNDKGQLGIGSLDNHNTPEKVGEENKWKTVSA